MWVVVLSPSRPSLSRGSLKLKLILVTDSQLIKNSSQVFRNNCVTKHQLWNFSHNFKTLVIITQKQQVAIYNILHRKTNFLWISFAVGIPKSFTFPYKFVFRTRLKMCPVATNITTHLRKLPKHNVQLYKMTIQIENLSWGELYTNCNIVTTWLLASLILGCWDRLSIYGSNVTFSKSQNS